jgi:hypothetical protein
MGYSAGDRRQQYRDRRSQHCLDDDEADRAPADQVDVKAELAALRDALAELKKVPDRGKLDRAIEDAVEETRKAKPDKAEVGGALERVGKYAKAADDFGEHAEKLLPRLAALGSWLGAHGHNLLAMLGVSP